MFKKILLFSGLLLACGLITACGSPTTSSNSISFPMRPSTSSYNDYWSEYSSGKGSSYQSSSSTSKVTSSERPSSSSSEKTSSSSASNSRPSSEKSENSESTSSSSSKNTSSERPSSSSSEKPSSSSTSNSRPSSEESENTSSSSGSSSKPIVSSEDSCNSSSEEMSSESSSSSSSSPIHTCKFNTYVVPATCISKGYTRYECVCGNYFDLNITDYTDHYFVDDVCMVCKARDYSSFYFEYSSELGGYIIVDYTGSLENLVIPSSYEDEPVVLIGSNAFAWNHSIVNVTIPSSIKGIGSNAFDSCYNLETITIEEGCEYIDSYCFEVCSSLKEVKLPSSLLTLGEGAFMQCENLQVVNLPEGIVEIKDNTFKQCTNLIEIAFSKNMEIIGSYAFENCEKIKNIPELKSVVSIGNLAFYMCTSLEKIVISSSLETIKENSFNSCYSLEKVELPSTLLEIGEYAFAYCYSLENIALPENLEKINDYAFYNCSFGPEYGLKSIVIPGSVQTIGQSAFYACNNLTEVVFSEGVTKIGCAFEYCESLNVVYLPTTLEEIESNAFCGCYNLKTVYNLSELPIAVKEYENGCVAYYADIIYASLDGEIGGDSRYSYTEIDGRYYLTSYSGNEKEITLPKTYKGESYDIGSSAFSNSSIVQITIPEGVKVIGKSAFHNCRYLEKVVLPSTLNEIEEYAFYYCDMLTEIIIPEGVTNIGYKSFNYCINLESVELPSTLESIGENAFYKCEKLEKIVIPYNVTKIGDSAFYGCESLLYVYNLSSLSIESKSSSYGYVGYYTPYVYTSLEDEEVVFENDDYIFIKIDSEYYLYSYRGNEENLVLPSNINGNSYSIFDEAFSNDKQIKSVVIPEGVTNIGYKSFNNCINLESVELPSTLKNIGSYAFNSCKNLTDITFKEGLESIEYQAFYECNKLTEIVIPEGVTSISSWTFYRCSSLISVTLPSTLSYINDYVFYYCTSLTEIVIPEGVTEIGKYAFSCCHNLLSVTLPSSLEKIDYFSFASCTSIYVVINNSSLDITKEGGNYGDLTNCAYLVTSDNDVYYDSYEFGDFSILELQDKVYITKYNGVQTELVLPNTINGKSYEIGINAFKDCKSIESIIIPEGVEYIEKNSFYRCSNLKEVILPSTLESIGEYAFYECYKLEKIVIPYNVKKIGNLAFCGCDSLAIVINLSELDISLDVWDNSYINYYAVYISTDENASIEKVVYGDYIFFDLGETMILYKYNGYESSLVLPENINGKSYEIGRRVFYNKNYLMDVVIPEGVTKIGSCAFNSCSFLTCVELPSTLEVISEEAFTYCERLNEIILPASLKEIGDRAFECCYNLSSVYNLSSLYIEAGSTNYGYVGYYAPIIYTSLDDENIFVDYYDSDYTFIKINDKYYLFSYNGSSAYVELPGDIYGNPYDIYDRAFENCYRLEEVYIPDCVSEIGEGAFKSCYNLREIRLPYSIKAIENETFYGCSNLIKIEIPEGVTIIGTYAFANCVGLQEIILPTSLEGILDYAFEWCESLYKVVNYSNLYIEAGSWEYGQVAYYAYLVTWDENAYINVFEYDNYTFVELEDKMYLSKFDGWATDLDLPDNVNGWSYDIGHRAFADKNFLVNVKIPEGVTYIGEYAFRYCNSLETIELPSTLEVIDVGAFEYNSNLKEIVIPGNVYDIQFDAFWECKSLFKVVNLSNLDIVAGSTDYGYVAYYASLVTNDINETYEEFIFDDCQFIITGDTAFLKKYVGNKSELVLPETINGYSYEICSYAFDQNQSLTKVVLPEGIKNLKEYTFYLCNNIKEIVLPTSLETIDSYAVCFCENLDTVVLPHSLVEFGDYAFNGCNNLLEVYNLSNLTILPSKINYYTIAVHDSLDDESIYVDYEDSNFKFIQLDGVYYLYSYLSNEESVKLPDNIYGNTYNIYKRAFSNKKIKAINIPEGVEYIGESAFSYCINLEVVYLPSTLQSIDKEAFLNCYSLFNVYNLSDLTITKGSEEYGCVGYYAYLVTSDINETPEESIIYEDYKVLIFEGEASILKYLGNQNVVNIPSEIYGATVSKIGIQSFISNYEIKKVIIPEGVTIIDAYAFEGCDNLQEVSLPSSLEKINYGSFIDCDKLKLIVIPENVTEIGRQAFDYCYSLNTVFNNSNLFIDGYYYDDKGCLGKYASNIYNKGEWEYVDGVPTPI